MITTIAHIPPTIIQHFNAKLLDRLLWMRLEVKARIIPNATKKIRPQDIKKRRIFDSLVKEFYEEYERKKKEEDDYKAKIKAAPKMPSFSNQGHTCRFERIRPKE